MPMNMKQFSLSQRLISIFQRLSYYLRAQSCLLVEHTFHKITELLGGNLTLASYAYTARMTNHFAHHVLSLRWWCVCVLLAFSAYRPLCDIIRPDVGRHASRSLTKSEIDQIRYIYHSINFLFLSLRFLCGLYVYCRFFSVIAKAKLPLL